MSRAQSVESPPLCFKNEPFFEALAEIVPPMPLVDSGCEGLQCKCILFRLSPQQMAAVSSSLTENAKLSREGTMEVHLRFCLLDTNSEQDDRYPSDLAVNVNGKTVELPAPIPCKDSHGMTEWVHLPIDITSLCTQGPSTLNKLWVIWQPASGRQYAVGLFLVKKLSAATILSGLYQLNAAVTRAMIKKKAKRRATIGEDVAITRFHVSLTCPLSRTRMTVPSRGRLCKHLDCFDGSSYLQVNERRPTWTCPVCCKPASLSSLVVDQLFTDILANAPGDCNGVVLHADGSWTPSPATQRADGVPTSALQSRARSSASPSDSLSSEQVTRQQPKIEVIDLTYSSSDNDQDCPALR
ncbi:hypothetical protein MRX96_019990 [Rhipicephalus microplus]